jgi:putative endonuclease
MQIADWLRRLKSGTSPPSGDHRAFGAWGEDEAAEFLRNRGMKVLARNYQCPGVKGDLDIIVWDQETLVFVEVKTRRSSEVRTAESAVNWQKRRALIRLARAYRGRQRRTPLRWRYDVVSVYPGSIQHFPNAFRES